MQKYWKGIQGDEHLYTHEWQNHGTCVNTIQPECYDDYQTSQEVVDYFERAVELHKQLPTYQVCSPPYAPVKAANDPL